MISLPLKSFLELEKRIDSGHEQKRKEPARAQLGRSLGGGERERVEGGEGRKGGQKRREKRRRNRKDKRKRRRK